MTEEHGIFYSKLLKIYDCVTFLSAPRFSWVTKLFWLKPAFLAGRGVGVEPIALPYKYCYQMSLSPHFRFLQASFKVVGMWKIIYCLTLLLSCSLSHAQGIDEPPNAIGQRNSAGQLVEQTQTFPRVGSYYQNSAECMPLFWFGESGLELLQQCRIAVGTEKMAFWAMLAFWAGLAGVAVVALTLIETKRANAAALRAAMAAEAAVASNRAWLGYDSASIIAHPVGDGLQYKLTVKFRNSGQSPARNVKLRAGTRYSNPADYVDINTIEVSETVLPLGNIAPANICNASQPLPEDEFSRICNFGTNSIFCRMILEYESNRVNGVTEVMVVAYVPQLRDQIPDINNIPLMVGVGRGSDRMV